MFSVTASVDLTDTEMFRLSSLYVSVSFLEPWMSYLPLCSPKAALSWGYTHHIMHKYFVTSPFNTPNYKFHSSFVPDIG